MTEALQLEIRTLKELLDSERDPAGRAFAPLADAYRKAGRIPEALRILRDGISKHPNFVTGHVVAAQLYVEQGLAAEAAIAARRALELDGENVSALRSLLRALDETGAAEEAVGVRSLLTTLEPDFTPDWTTPGWAVVEDAHEPAEAALSPTVALSSLPLEPALEEPTAPEREDEAPSVPADGMIDLTSIGPIPSAELPASALLPDPSRSGEPGAPVELSGLDFSLADLMPSVEEQPSGAVTEPPIELASLAPESEDEPVMDLAMLAPETEDEPVMDLAMLAPESEGEPVMDLAMLAPESDDEPVMDLAMLAPEAEDEPVMDLAMLAPESDDEPVMDLAMLAPESEGEPVMDLAMLAPESDDEPVMDLAMLAPETEDEPVMDLAMLAPSVDDVLEDEPVMDVALLAPSVDDVPEDEPVMDLAMLAPSVDDVPEDEPVMDLALLAPSIDDVAEPSHSTTDTVVDVAALAPVSSEIEEPVFDLAALAPSATSDLETAASEVERALEAQPARDVNVPVAMVPDDEPVFELDALAPAEADVVATQATESAGPAEGSGNGLMADDDASQIGFVSSLSARAEPDEVVIDLDGLRVESTAASAGPLSTAPLEVEISAAGSTPTEVTSAVEAADVVTEPAEPSSPPDADTPSDDQGEPIFTRTLAELYAAQGAVKEAVAVLRHLLAENPGNEALTRRIAELESGAPVARSPREEVPAALPGQDDEEVEALARELAESGRGSHETESPFAWTDRESSPPWPTGPTIREYFDGLLKWEPRDR